MMTTVYFIGMPLKADVFDMTVIYIYAFFGMHLEWMFIM